VIQWLKQKLGLPGAAILCIITVGALVWAATSQKDEAAQSSSNRVMICSETMQTFDYTLKEGDIYPVMSPYSEKKTGWPAEKCYWTKDGQAKRTPTYILLNEYIGKEGPTVCPDCGRKVRARNPLPPPSKWRELSEKEKGQPSPEDK
jgi:hypothetical protein